MLLDTTSAPKQGDVIGFRILTGEEIIGRLQVTTVTHVTISKPILAQMAQMANGHFGVGFGPFMATVPEDGKFEFLRDNMITNPMRVRPDISAKYTEMTSGIIPAGAGLLG